MAEPLINDSKSTEDLSGNETAENELAGLPANEDKQGLSDITLPDDEETKNAKKQANIDYMIDDDRLADLEKSLTSEKKAELRKESLELKADGNSHFGSGEFEEAVRNYTKALNTCPLCFAQERSVLYANRAAASAKLKRNDTAIEDCTKAVELNACYLKAYQRRALLYREMEKLDEALQDYQRILELDPNNLEARKAVVALPQEINERNEKLKAEMMGKLKELGNLFLKPFGLSTENFNLVQDPNSGGYSVNFQNSPKPS